MSYKHISNGRKSGWRERVAKTFAFFLVLALVVTSLSMEAEARRRRKSRKSKPKTMQVINEPKLYERLGGAKGLSDIVDEWMRLNLADSRIASEFTPVTSHPERLVKLRRNLNDQLCELADGPCQYRGPDMDKAHKGLKITEEQYLAFAENLFRSMQKSNIPEREKNEMLARLDEYRADILESGGASTETAKAAN